MSFQPITGTGIGPSLLGVGDPIKFIRPVDNDPLEDRTDSRDLHGDRDSKGTNYIKTVLLVVISALIFVSIVALFDVLRNALDNYYAKQALENPASGNTETDIAATEIANQYNLLSSIVFASITSLISIILIIILILVMKCL
jgi:hypothetical protein